MSLLALQRTLRDQILAVEPDGVPLGAERGLAVYRHAYRAQLAACLRETFAKTHAWLGDAAFDAASQHHIVDHTPHSWTLGDYGEGFEHTLGRLYPQDPEVIELAWLDWGLSKAFDGPDAAPISPEALAAVDWDRAVLHFVPTLIMGEVRSNAGAIWSALAEGAGPPPAAVLPRNAALRIWRLDLSPQFRTIDSLERQALDLALSGASFAEVCDRLAHQGDDDQAAPALGAMLGRWLQDGLITSIT